jgi:hypothetical protein
MRSCRRSAGRYRPLKQVSPPIGGFRQRRTTAASEPGPTDQHRPTAPRKGGPAPAIHHSGSNADNAQGQGRAYFLESGMLSLAVAVSR